MQFSENYEKIEKINARKNPDANKLTKVFPKTPHFVLLKIVLILWLLDSFALQLIQL